MNCTCVQCKTLESGSAAYLCPDCGHVHAAGSFLPLVPFVAVLVAAVLVRKVLRRETSPVAATA